MRQMKILWCDMCVVVMLRPQIIAGDPEEQEHRLEEAVKDAALANRLSATLYRWMHAMSGGEDFFAWNIGHRDLLAGLLSGREAGEIDFLAYYRTCDLLTAVIPEEDFFRGR